MSDFQDYVAKYQISEVQARILANAELSDEEIAQVLQPQTESVLVSTPELEKIVVRLERARDNKEKIVVVGDYDADGICATAIITQALKCFGMECGFYIPNRLQEGYGLSREILKAVSSKGYRLVLTVDNGVKATAALEYAKTHDMEVIVTDHHIVPEDAEYEYLLHPGYLAEKYQTMCGAGVALYLARSLLQDELPDLYYILAMIATIADMMPVFAENRFIIRKGLELLKKGNFPAVAALLDKDIAKINETDIAFQVVPKINTVGRLADRSNPNNLVRYFALEDSAEIQLVATQINRLNNERKEMTAAALEKLAVPKKVAYLNLVFGEDIHEGITGLLAGRLVNQLQEPVLVLSKTDAGYKGSGRSTDNFDIHRYLQPLEAHLTAFGGHKNACGLEVADSEFVAFTDALELLKPAYVSSEEKTVFQAVEIKAAELNFEIIAEIDALRPFGSGFTQPQFLIQDFSVGSLQKFSRDYLKWESADRRLEALYFKNDLDYNELLTKIKMDFYGSLQLSEFRGKRKIAIIVDTI